MEEVNNDRVEVIEEIIEEKRKEYNEFDAKFELRRKYRFNDENVFTITSAHQIQTERSIDSFFVPSDYPSKFIFTLFCIKYEIFFVYFNFSFVLFLNFK